MLGKDNYDCGKLNVIRLGDLRQKYQNLNLVQNTEKLKFKISYSTTFDYEKYEISNIQYNNPNSVIMVASNFNALESINKNINPNSADFLTSYHKDHTQGPAASVGCGAATIYRCLHYPNLNMLQNFDYYNTTNGYPNLSQSAIDKSPNSDNYISIYQTDVEVNYIHKNPEEIELVKDKRYVTQVFAAAVNRHQGMDGQQNNAICFKNPLLASMPLECGYETAYLVTILENKPLIELCLLGGGVFKNSLENILTAISKIHKKYQNKYGNVKCVELKLFGPQQTQNVLKMKSILNSFGIDC